MLFRTADSPPEDLWIDGNYTGAGTNPVPFDRYIDDIVITYGPGSDPPNLTLNLSASQVLENNRAGVMATLTRNGASFAAPLTVMLASSDRSEATVPRSVTIPAGQASVAFRVASVDDRLMDGTQAVTLTATAPGMTASSVTLSVLDNEHAPVARDDTAATRANTAFAIRVLTNDSDVDRDRLRVVAVSNGAHGKAVVLADGRVRYTPARGFMDTDTFTYRIGDGTGGRAMAPVRGSRGGDRATFQRLRVSVSLC